MTESTSPDKKEALQTIELQVGTVYTRHRGKGVLKRELTFIVWDFVDQEIVLAYQLGPGGINSFSGSSEDVGTIKKVVRRMPLEEMISKFRADRESEGQVLEEHTILDLTERYNQGNSIIYTHSPDTTAE